MAAHDRLPAPLRAWAAQAALPWSAPSLRRLWDRALAETGCPQAALDRLAAAERARLAAEAGAVWGAAYPAGDAGAKGAAAPSAPAAHSPPRIFGERRRQDGGADAVRGPACPLWDKGASQHGTPE